MVADRDAVDPFQGQHAASGAAPVDAGHPEAAELGRGVAGDVVGHLGDGGGLQPHVHLDLDGVGERVHHRHGLQPARGRVEALDLARGEEVAVEVAPEALLDAGAQDLDGDLAALAVVDRHRLVHLGDGGGGDRRAELGEVILQPAAELDLDRPAGFLHGERRQPILQVPEVAGQLRPDQIGAGGEELAELDVAGAEARECGGDAGVLGLARTERPGQDADGQRRRAGEPQRQRRAGPGRHEAHAVLGQNQPGAGEAEDVADGCGHWVASKAVRERELPKLIFPYAIAAVKASPYSVTDPCDIDRPPCGAYWIPAFAGMTPVERKPPRYEAFLGDAMSADRWLAPILEDETLLFSPPCHRWELQVLAHEGDARRRRCSTQRRSNSALLSGDLRAEIPLSCPSPWPRA